MLKKENLDFTDYNTPNLSKEKEPNVGESAFIQKLDQSIKQLDDSYQEIIPPNYLTTQESLIKKEISSSQERLTIFHGGPMRWEEKYQITDGWLTPIEYVFISPQGQEISVIFHLLSINCHSGEDFSEAQLQINLASDDDLKLKTDDHDYLALRNTIMTGKNQKVAILRPSFNGSLAFPLIHSCADLGSAGITNEIVANGIKKITAELGLSIESNDYTLGEKINRSLNKQKIKNPTLICQKEQLELLVGEQKEINTENGIYYLVEIINKSSQSENNKNVWLYYKIYSAKPLADIDKDDFVTLRIDSGCDMGMNYFDQGCDCHDQLIQALKKIRLNDGLIVHLPTQDGRGYGTNTKCLTEGLKWGTDVISKQATPQGPMKTTKAAEAVFGEGRHDIRTYRHAFIALSELGLKKVALISDNNQKVWSAGRVFGVENVKRVDTNTIAHSIKNEDDPLGIAHMLLKLAQDPSYAGLNAELLDNYLNYAGIIYDGADDLDAKLAKIEKFIQQNE